MAEELRISFSRSFDQVRMLNQQGKYVLFDRLGHLTCQYARADLEISAGALLVGSALSAAASASLTSNRRL